MTILLLTALHLKIYFAVIGVSLDKHICCKAWSDAVASWIVLLFLNVMATGLILYKHGTSKEAVSAEGDQVCDHKKKCIQG